MLLKNIVESDCKNMLGYAFTWLTQAKDSVANFFLGVPVTIFVTLGIIFFIAIFLFAFKKKD